MLQRMDRLSFLNQPLLVDQSDDGEELFHIDSNVCLNTGTSEHIDQHYESDLSSEKITHNGKQALVCKTCDKIFSKASDLHRHELIHTGERRFICKTCNKAFTQSSSLRSHESVHTGVGRFICATCSKQFHFASLLRTGRGSYRRT